MLDAFDPDLDQLVAANREQLIPIAQQVAKTERWSLSLRCAVIDCSSGLPAVHNSSVGGIGSFIRTSTVIDHPLMEQFLALVNSQGVDAALDTMANNVGESDEFNTLYDAYLEERQQGQLMWGAGDATEFVMKSQDCFQDRLPTRERATFPPKTAQDPPKGPPRPHQTTKNRPKTQTTEDSNTITEICNIDML